MKDHTATIEPEDYRQIVQLKLVLLGLIGICAFLNSLLGITVLDDQRWIIDNADIRSLGMAGTAWLSPRRVALFSLALNHAVSGTSAWSAHLLNVVLHIAAALTLFGIVCRTLLRVYSDPQEQLAAPWLAFVAALLWLVHPLQTQAVTYLSQRAELLAGLFYLLTLYCVIRGAEDTHRMLWNGLAVASLALGMGTREVLLTAPLIVLLYDRAFLAESYADLWSKRRSLYLGLGACAALFLVLNGVAWPDMRDALSDGTTPQAFIATQPSVIVRYLHLAFVPYPLTLDYFDWPSAQSVGDPAAALLALLLLLVVVGWAVVRSPRLGFLGAWFFLTLLPATLMPAGSVVNEARMYLPLASIVVLVVVGGHALVRKVSAAPWAQWAALGLVMAVIAGFGLQTFLRNRDFYSAEALWLDTVRKRPDNARAHLNLGNAYYQEKKLDDAIIAYKQVLSCASGTASKDLRTSAYNNLAVVFLAGNRSAEAVQFFATVPRSELDAAYTLGRLGFILWAKQDHAAAIHLFRESVKQRPEAAQYRFALALTLHDSGDKGEAEKEVQEGLRLEANWPRTARERAWARATDADPAKRNPSEAIFLARQADLATGEQQPDMLDTLAAAYACAGRFPDAVTAAEKARQLAEGKKPELASAIGQRLNLYKAQQPFYQGHADP